MKCYRCSNVARCTLLGAGIHPWMNYRLRLITEQGVQRGGGIMPEVSWTSDTHVGGVTGLVEPFRTTFLLINSSVYCNNTGHIIGQTVRRGAVRCSVC